MKILLVALTIGTSFGAAPADSRDPLFDEFVATIPTVPSISGDTISKADHESELDYCRMALISHFKELKDVIYEEVKKRHDLLLGELNSLKDDYEIARKKVSDLERDNLTLRIENSAKDQKIRSLESPSILGRFGRLGL